jgi:hypothetical protein
VLVAALVAGLAVASCGGGGDDRSGTDATTASTASTGTATTEEPAERDYTASTGPSCTVGTIADPDWAPPGCDRLYSPFLAPGGACTEGQDPDCVDPDGDVLGGGTCLVERKDADRCRDDDGDGALDEPLPDCPMSTIPPDAPDIVLPPGCEGSG